MAQEATGGDFHHHPLDHSTQSIRLVEILPKHLSSSSLVQCVMRPAMINAKYVCLSYRWGAPSPCQQVLINNKPFKVRQNLFDFLSMTYENQSSSQFYWIDALCIDQSNMAERNYQVVQMGEIYARAVCVHIWLGSNQALLPFLRILQKVEEEWTFREWGIVRSQHNALESFICRNEYWNRAWIVQEIFLARAVVVWANAVQFNFESLHWTLNYSDLSTINSIKSEGQI